MHNTQAGGITQNKIKVYHGTSADNLKFILKHGIVTHESKIWNCSEDVVCVWEPEALAVADGKEDEEMEYKQQRAFNRAFESAQCTMACATDCRAVVIEIEVNESELMIDESHENINYARCIHRNIKPEEITSIKISNDLSLLKGYFIGLMLSNDLSNIEFTEIEKKIGEIFNKSETYLFEEMDSTVEWEEIKKEELIES